MGAVITGAAVPMRSGVTLMAQVYGTGAAAGIPITQASLSAVAYALTDMGSPTGVNPVTGALTALIIGSVVFDSFQLDGRWTKDSVGYNFLTVLPASLFASASPNRQHVDVKFTPVSGEVFYAQFEWTPLVGYA